MTFIIESLAWTRQMVGLDVFYISLFREQERAYFSVRTQLEFVEKFFLCGFGTIEKEVLIHFIQFYFQAVMVTVRLRFVEGSEPFFWADAA